MTPFPNIPFRYSQDLLSECAATLTDADVVSSPSSSSCQQLWGQYKNHFGSYYVGNFHTEGAPLAEEEEAQFWQGRYHLFLQSVQLVSTHNQESLKSASDTLGHSAPLHTITLNQFSATFPHELPLTGSAVGADEKSESAAGRFSDFAKRTDKKIGTFPGLKMLGKLDRRRREQLLLEGATSPGGRRLEEDGDESDLLEKEYGKYLNWATTDNPDGVSIVHPAEDEGHNCEAGWAWAATGTLEASVARGVAHETAAQIARSTYDEERDEAEEEEWIADIEYAAQKAEEAAIEEANFSTQELIDCDTENAGCGGSGGGGDPAVSFNFIYHYGLTTKQLYPYEGQQWSCWTEWLSRPVVTVEDWYTLTSDYEDEMEAALRSMGPIAVRMNAIDATFRYYYGGIYAGMYDCDQEPNHSLLIVGYGEEGDDGGPKTRYWIARNSWGEVWGEKGYVRIRRGSGAFGEEGVCGIAKSPSFAIGGRFLTEGSVSSPTLLGAKNNKYQEARVEEEQEALLGTPLQDLLASPSGMRHSGTADDKGPLSIQAAERHRLIVNYCNQYGKNDFETCGGILANQHGGGAFMSFAVVATVAAMFLLLTVWRTRRSAGAGGDPSPTLSSEYQPLAGKENDEEGFEQSHDAAPESGDFGKSNPIRGYGAMSKE